jgi:hypothetical protein
MKQNRLDNKTHELLEKEKLQAEIDILHARLEKEFPDEKPPGFMDKLAGFANKWSSFVLGAVALFSAVFGVFVPLSEYLDEQRKALEYDLNENMISFVDGLNSEDPSVARRSIMMLSYYETNSIPILLFFMEDSRNNQNEFRKKIIETIGLIYADTGDKSIIEKILVRIQSNFNQLIEGKNGTIDTRRLTPLYNFFELINGMDLSDSDREEVLTVFKTMKSSICSDEMLRDDFDMLGVHATICLYMGVEDKCD